MLGLIAGAGLLPGELARAARRRGWRVAAVAFPGHTDPGLEAHADCLAWRAPGEIAAAAAALRAAGATRAVLAGKLEKAALYGETGALRLDADARALLASLPDQRDDSLLTALAGYLEARGIELLPQAALAPELLAGAGPLGRVAPTPEILADVAFGWPLATAIAGLDIGQTVIVKDRAVLAVEAIEGTDAAIRRAGRIAAGACAIKVAKPRQDPRFDLPAVGPDTVAALAAAGAAALAFAAGRTLVLRREELAERADASGIAVLGVGADGSGFAQGTATP